MSLAVGAGGSVGGAGVAGTAPRTGVRAARHALRAPLALAAAALTGTALVVPVDPHTTHVPLCPFHAATGLWCPLCGGLRAAHDAATGHLTAALTDNAALLVAAPLLVWWWARWVGRARAGRPGAPVHGATVLVAAVVLVGFAVVRNTAWGAGLAP